jgi:hypothetical protein
MIAAKSRRPTIAAAASLLAHDVVTKRIRDTLIVANLMPRSARNGHLPDPHGAPQAAILVSFLEFLQISHDLIKCKNRGSLPHDGQLPERKPTFECPPRSAGERRRVAELSRTARPPFAALRPRVSASLSTSPSRCRMPAGICGRTLCGTSKTLAREGARSLQEGA